MKKIALPFVYLIIGGVAGYSLRSIKHSSSTITASSDHSGLVKPGAKADKVGSKAQEASVKSATEVSLKEQIQDILTDFDLKSARKATAKFSMSELQQALALTAAMTKTTDRDQLRAQLYRSWAALDPNAAWQAALVDPFSKTNGSLLGSVAGELAKTNPTAALSLTLQLSMGEKRASVMRALFSDWSSVDVIAAMIYSNTHPDQPVEGHSFGSGLAKLAEKDPIKAANATLSLKDSMSRQYTLTQLMTSWVGNDPSAALKWADTLTNPTLKRDALAAAISAWAKTDPAAAMAHAQSISDPEARSNSLKKGWTDWFRQDPEAATTYMATSADSKLLESLRFTFGYMTESLSTKERAALLAKLPDSEAKQETLNTMSDSHIRKGQYNQALELLNSLPDSSQRDHSVHKLGTEWAAADLKAAAAWIKIQPDSTDKDLAIAGYSNTLARTDPNGALQWARSIPDSKMRVGAMINIATRWLRNAPAKAEAWIAQEKSFSASDIRSIRMFAKMEGDYLPSSVSVGTRR